MDNLFEKSGADFSICREYRYSLWRIWDESKPMVTFIGLNPSTADETQNDATIRRVIRFAKTWGYGGVTMLNCYPLISTNPELMTDFEYTPFHDMQYASNICYMMEKQKEGGDIVFAWGAFEVAKSIGVRFANMFPDAKCLGKNKDGSPKHPLYVKGDTQLINYNS